VVRLPGRLNDDAWMSDLSAGAKRQLLQDYLYHVYKIEVCSVNPIRLDGEVSAYNVAESIQLKEVGWSVNCQMVWDLITELF